MSEENKTLARLRADLDEWRTRLDEARVQAKLGRMEARDKLQEFEKRLTPTLEKARKSLDEVVTSGTSEAKVIGKSLLAGWDELRHTHEDLSREADKESRKTSKR